MNVDTLQSVECGRAPVALEKSLIRHWLAGLGVFAARPFRHCIVVGYCFGSFVYLDLCRRQNITLTYAEWSMVGTEEKFQIKANHLHERVVHWDNVGHNVSIVPAAFCAMHEIKGGRYLIRG